MARAAAEWLLGRNRFSAQLYDLATGAWADGLDPQDPSFNQGAESVICALLTLLVVAEKCDSVLGVGDREAVAFVATPPVQASHYAAAAE